MILGGDNIFILGSLYFVAGWRLSSQAGPVFVLGAAIPAGLWLEIRYLSETIKPAVWIRVRDVELVRRMVLFL